MHLHNAALSAQVGEAACRRLMEHMDSAIGAMQTLVDAMLRGISDPLLLTVLLRNLITNAMKITQSGSVTVRARLDADRQICIDVADTGPGLPPGHTAVGQASVHVGTVVAADGARRTGLGMGLAIVRRITATLGGQLIVDSTCGVCSVFTVVILSDIEVTAPTRIARPVA